jgi:hypothetical protein
MRSRRSVFNGFAQDSPLERRTIEPSVPVQNPQRSATVFFGEDFPLNQLNERWRF